MAAKSKAELESFLNSKEADFGLTPQVRQMIYHNLGDEDDAYKYFVNYLVSPKEAVSTALTTASTEDAARSYRAMNLLKEDLTNPSVPSVLIKSPTQAALLAKDLLSGLSSVHPDKRYSTLHIRDLLDSLLEAFPEKVMAAAAAGGQKGVEEHLGPLLTSDQTLTILTHLVCFGCTGRKGIASAEKSAQHTAMYHHMSNASGGKSKISLGQRRKFVRAMADFQLMDRLAQSLTKSTGSSDATMTDLFGEELCETILTILEVVGYPPKDVPAQAIANNKRKEDEVMVGEDILLSPLATTDWWKTLLETLQREDCPMEQREAIARTCSQVFALATGNSSRICKSHAPATDATEQTSEEIVQEKEEEVVNRLIEWGLTDKMHAALTSQLPILVQVLGLPIENILDHQATLSGEEKKEDFSEDVTIRHPGRYQTIPLGSWRLQLLSLLKEIVTYKGKKSDDANTTDVSPRVQAMDALMELPLPIEVQKKKKKGGAESAEDDAGENQILNPWPALCSFVWAYPNNDFYHIIFFEMFQAVVLEHHEATLRLILQKSKFLSRAVNSLSPEPNGPVVGLVTNCLNLLRLRSQSLPPSAFLAQYLGSHDGWKANVDKLIAITTKRETPIKSVGGDEVNLGLGGTFAMKLGLVDITEWDGSAPEAQPTSEEEHGERENEAKSGGKKKKKNKKKKKK